MHENTVHQLFLVFFFFVELVQIQPTAVNRLCKTQQIMTVNGQFPGPTLRVHNGDTLVIKVKNAGKYDISLHW